MKLKLTEDVAICLGGDVCFAKAGNFITVCEDGKVVDEDCEVLVSGSRYLLEKGDKVLVTEDLYGFRIMPGNTPIDRLITYCDHHYLEWDISNPKFQQAALHFLGVVPKTLAEWGNALASSAQPGPLKQHLLALIAAQIGAPTEAGCEEDECEDEEDGSGGGSGDDEEDDSGDDDGSGDDDDS